MGSELTQDKLEETLARHRAGKTVVTTNGCFDLLHVGHLRYLQAAAGLGDLLVVCLNSDASVQRLKGPSRPIVPESERAELLAGLNCVDYVVIFDQDTPVELLRAIQPDVHVKGAQYTEDELPEAPALREMGTRIELLPMVEGRSTSNLIERVLQAEQARA